MWDTAVTQCRKGPIVPLSGTLVVSMHRGVVWGYTGKRGSVGNRGNRKTRQSEPLEEINEAVALPISCQQVTE